LVFAPADLEARAALGALAPFFTFAVRPCDFPPLAPERRFMA
jgi:hypothetical protein